MRSLFATLLALTTIQGAMAESKCDSVTDSASARDCMFEKIDAAGTIEEAKAFFAWFHTDEAESIWAKINKYQRPWTQYKMYNLDLSIIYPKTMEEYEEVQKKVTASNNLNDKYREKAQEKLDQFKGYAVKYDETIDTYNKYNNNIMDYCYTVAEDDDSCKKYLDQFKMFTDGIHYSYARDDEKRADMKKTSAEFLKKYYEWRTKYGSLRKQTFLAKKTYQLDEVEALAAAAFEETQITSWQYSQLKVVFLERFEVLKVREAFRVSEEEKDKIKTAYYSSTKSTEVEALLHRSATSTIMNAKHKTFLMELMTDKVAILIAREFRALRDHLIEGIEKVTVSAWTVSGEINVQGAFAALDAIRVSLTAGRAKLGEETYHRILDLLEVQYYEFKEKDVEAYKFFIRRLHYVYKANALKREFLEGPPPLTSEDVTTLTAYLEERTEEIKGREEVDRHRRSFRAELVTRIEAFTTMEQCDDFLAELGLKGVVGGEWYFFLLGDKALLTKATNTKKDALQAVIDESNTDLRKEYIAKLKDISDNLRSLTGVQALYDDLKVSVLTQTEKKEMRVYLDNGVKAYKALRLIQEDFMTKYREEIYGMMDPMESTGLLKKFQDNDKLWETHQDQLQKTMTERIIFLIHGMYKKGIDISKYKHLVSEKDYRKEWDTPYVPEEDMLDIPEMPKEEPKEEPKTVEPTKEKPKETPSSDGESDHESGDEGDKPKSTKKCRVWLCSKMNTLLDALDHVEEHMNPEKKD